MIKKLEVRKNPIKYLMRFFVGSGINNSQRKINLHIISIHIIFALIILN
jgi:hypothetical protein